MQQEPVSGDNVPIFTRFVGIDWSGAAGTRHRGIAVAVAEAGDGPPVIVPPPSAAGWARTEVVEWLADQPGPLLAGCDFSFAPPFCDRGAYLPGLALPDSAPGFWRAVEAACGDADLGGSGFIHGPARPHFWLGAADGRKADFLRWRRCEQQFNAGGGGKAATLFDCVGAAQVAKASLSGMRMLHRLHGAYAIWPFAPPGPRTLVEIYARAMIRRGGGSGRKLRSAEELNRVLGRLGSRGVSNSPQTDHDSDALVAAAGLRYLAPLPRSWRPEGLTGAVARREGWTFGIS